MTSCTQPEGTTGSGLGSGLEGQVVVDTFLVSVDTSFAQPYFNMGAAPHLFVGSAAGVHTEALIRFFRPEFPDSFNLDSAKISLDYEGSIGDGSFPELEIQLLDYKWNESDSLKYGSIPQGDTVEYARTEIKPDTGEVDVYPSLDWVQGWIDWDYGGGEDDTSWTDTTRIDSALTIHITASEAARKILRFRSRFATTDTLRPQMTFYITNLNPQDDEEAQDELVSTADDDIFLVQNDSTDTGQHLIIGSGAVFQTNLKFDVSPLWEVSENKYIVVNRATVLLYKKENQHPILPKTVSVWPMQITSDNGFTAPLDAEESGIVISATAIDTASAMVSMVVNEAAADWVTGEDLNHGLAVHSATEGYDLDRIIFHSMESPDPAVHPRLVLYYTEFVK